MSTGRIFLPGNSRYRRQMPTSIMRGCLGFWPGNEASGDLKDWSGRNVHGTDTNTVTQVDGTGRVASARQFTSATSEWFSVSHASFGSLGDVPATFQAFCNFTNATDHTILDKYSAGNGWVFSMASAFSNKLSLDVYSGGVYRGSGNSATVMSAGVWYHCLGQHDPDANTLTCFLNNVPGPVGATTGVGADSGAALGIGARTAGSIFMNGPMFNLMIHDRLLGRDEISWCYNAGLAQLASRIIERRAA